MKFVRDINNGFLWPVAEEEPSDAEIPRDVCPKCASTDVEAAEEVMGCLSCGWTRMGETPCDTCGEPSVMCYSVGKGLHYHCRKHSPDQDTIFREMARAIVDWRGR